VETGTGALVRGTQGRMTSTARRITIVVMVLLVVFVAVSARLIVWPAQGMPSRVDAVIMLAGPGNRLPVALGLVRAHRAPVLVVSRGSQGYGGPCPAATAVPGEQIICFDPVPADTRGESEFAARLAERNGWRSVALVTTPDQDTRARMMMRRCYAGSVYVVTAPLPLSQWPYQIAYGWGALFKAVFLRRACLAWIHVRCEALTIRVEVRDLHR
jgi:uncharacterized SAM-binding protein YcdF (DUF218 family)